MAAGGMARFKDAVPIPIDGPGVNLPSTSQIPAHQSNIIRPVVLSPVHQTPTVEQEKRAIIQQIPSISSMKKEDSKYSSVHRIRQIPNQSSNLTTFSPSPSTDTGFRSIAASEKVEERKEGSSEKEDKREKVASSQEKERSVSYEKEEERGKLVTYGATGPIKGKVIHKENLVITPEGITVREAILRKEKPAVPPKPKQIISTCVSASVQEGLKNQQGQGNQDFSKSQEVQLPKAQGPPVPPPKPKTEIVISKSVEKGFEKLLEPLDSILKDAEELTVLSQGKQFSGNHEEQKSEKLETPTVISVSSEDHPDVQKVHLLNGEIPYTLTMRNIDSVNQPPAMSTFGPGTSTEVKHFEEQTKITIDLKHRKTLDFVSH